MLAKKEAGYVRERTSSPPSLRERHSGRRGSRKELWPPRIMERGSSAPWSQILQETIGEGRLNGEALRDYFRPLEDWLRSENLRTGEYLGWSYDGDYCKFSIETAGLQVYGGFYNAAHRHFDVTSFVIILLTSMLITTRFNLRWR
ncbi:hypothetical protein SFRURICE_011656 [Spodoptera frugiperda]|nr:hypothetical protein SFRURICE_011656 [Spodoptera frugiperda]